MSENKIREIPKVYESEYRMCCILWEKEPIRIAELAKLCDEQLGWSRTTTYTVVHRLNERGLLQSENGSVRTLFTKEQVQSSEMEELFEKTFGGSIPAFMAAFVKNRNLSEKEIAEISAMIEEHAKGSAG